jgi:hypothetical protein
MIENSGNYFNLFRKFDKISMLKKVRWTIFIVQNVVVVFVVLVTR